MIVEYLYLLYNFGDNQSLECFGSSEGGLVMQMNLLLILICR